MDKLEQARLKINGIDRQMAELFVERMSAVREVSEYKREHGLKVVDPEREAAIIKSNLSYVPEELRGLYAEFLRDVMDVAKSYQRGAEVKGEGCITLSLGDRSYDILVKRGSLSCACSFMDLDRKVLIVTDDGVPAEYAKTIALQCAEPYIVTLEQGEKTKNLDSFRLLLCKMLENRFTRKDCVIAVGGGVIGDLAGFAASAYMRGIDFYNVPTTTLSQIDSSIGGKVAVDLDGYKNTVGAFWQPRFVLVDPDTLKTLDRRQISSGLAEAVKMSLCFDAGLFEMFESGGVDENIEEVIRRSLMIKKSVVEQDEKESGLRRVLNFGHTVGHGIETAEAGRLTHGECVGLGMLPMCSAEVRKRLAKVLTDLGMPLKTEAALSEIKSAMLHDKKSENSGVTVVRVDVPGSYRLEAMTFDSLFSELDSFYGREA